MKRSICKAMSDNLINVGAIKTNVDVSNTYSDLFQKKTLGSIEDAVEVGYFDERYQKSASKGGKYPIASDLNNIFNIGITHGKRRTLGIPHIWNQNNIEAISGYPKNSIVMDENYNRFISTRNNNTSSLPQEGETSSNWIPLKAKAGFNKKLGLGPNNWYPTKKMKFDIARPARSSGNGTFLIKKFSGKDINLSGMIMFLDTDYSGGLKLASDLFTSGEELEENGIIHGSFKMNISTYPDLLENDEYKDNYINLISHYGIAVKYAENSYFHFWTESNLKPFPISKNQTYYLYLELDNSGVTGAPPADPDRPFGCTYIEFPRTLSWPGAGKL